MSPGSWLRDALAGCARNRVWQVSPPSLPSRHRAAQPCPPASARSRLANTSGRSLMGLRCSQVRAVAPAPCGAVPREDRRARSGWALWPPPRRQRARARRCGPVRLDQGTWSALPCPCACLRSAPPSTLYSRPECTLRRSAQQPVTSRLRPRTGHRTDVKPVSVITVKGP